MNELVLEGYRSHVLSLDSHVVIHPDNALIRSVANHNDKTHVVSELLELDALDEALEVDLCRLFFVSFRFHLHLDRLDRILCARLLRDPDSAVVVKLELGLLQVIKEDAQVALIVLIRIPLSDCDGDLVLVDVDGKRLNLANVVRQLQEAHAISLYMPEGNVSADRVDQKHATKFFRATLLQSYGLFLVEAERVLITEMLGVLRNRYSVEDSFHILDEENVVLH